MSFTNVSLVEWQTLQVPEASASEGLVSRFDRETSRVVDELASSRKLEVLQLRSGIEIRATSWVGRVTLGDLTITVRPKIEGTRLQNLVRYAYSLRDLKTFTPTAHDIANEAFQDLIVVQLANETAELLSRGMHRDYLRFNAELASPMGRIDFVWVPHSLAAARPAVVCTYYSRSDAILLNRVLLAGLHLAAKVSTDSQLSARVLRLAQVLEDNVPVIQLTMAVLDKASRAIDRRTTAYTSSLTLIRMLLSGMGVSIAEPSGAISLPGFLFDMNVFFQSLMSRLLHDELRELSIHDEHRLNKMFEYDPANNPQHRRAVEPRPDFALFSHGKLIELLDAKYRDLWQKSLPRNMLYQLAIYALSANIAKPQATILYPTMAFEAVDQVVLLKDPIFGRKLARIVLRPVNLLQLEELIRPRQDPRVARERQAFAQALVFGAKPAASPDHHLSSRR